jgi:transposase
MKDAAESLPSDLAAAHAMILTERAARLEAEAVAASAKAEAAGAQADRSSHEALIAHLKLEIEKLRRELYGSSSERKARLLQQMELQLEDLEAAATEDELAAEQAAAGAQTARPPQRKRPLRKPFPDHLPRERVVIAAPESCPCCGSAEHDHRQQIRAGKATRRHMERRRRLCDRLAVPAREPLAHRSSASTSR